MLTNATVSVIDDDPDIRDALALLMKSVGIRCCTFGSAQEFLDTYQPGQIGCVVLDVRMPGMSGIELQASGRIDLPVIIMTGHGDVAMAVRAMKNGAFDFIEKPFNDQVLLDAVQQAVRQSLKSQDLQATLAEIQQRQSTLTPRELDVMAMVVDGKSN